jgi:mannan endo-1,4-beta-mannosidase
MPGQMAHRARAAGRAVRRALPPLLLLAAIVALIGYRGASTAVSRPVGWHPNAVSGAGVDLGATTIPLARNEWRAWGPRDLDSVSAFEHAARKHLSVVMWYSDWAHGSLSRTQLTAVGDRGSVPEITWEPWDYTKGAYSRQDKYSLRSIADGAHDAYIRSWARGLASYGKPVRLRFAQEMNGNWYPWSVGSYGNRGAEFVAAWRHVHDLFRAAGATNVLWVWSPVALAESITAQEYPGDRYVDMVGLSLFNGGAQLKYNRWQTFAAKIRRPLAVVQRIAPDKPVEISEVGVAERGGDKARWIREMFQTLATTPQIVSLIWFNVPTSSDWRIETSHSTEEAFAAGADNPRYR